MKQWKIEPVGERDRAAALALLLASDNTAETETAVAQALERVGTGSADARSLVWAHKFAADHSASAIGACWIEGQAGNIGYLHLPVVDPSMPERESCEQELFAAAEAAARSAGATWLQTLLDPDHKAAALLARLGLKQVSTLVYQAALPPFSGREPTVLRIRPLPYTAEQRPLLAEILAATYEASLDCPLLNGTRNAEETLASYETIGQSGTWHWQLIYRAETPIGCLLLGVHTPEEEGACAFGEMIYWGVVPSVRGEGLGREILEFALWKATQLQLDKLVLAVDAANTPALRLYQELGFFEWLRKEAWGKQVPA